MEENISKLEKMIQEKNELDKYLDKKLYITPSEYQNIKPEASLDDNQKRMDILNKKREIQEQKINSELSFLGTINSTASKMLSGASKKCKELISNFASKEEQDDIKNDAKDLSNHMDEVYTEAAEEKSNALVVTNSEKNELLTLPNDIVDNLSQQQLLALEKENGEARKLTNNSNKGSIFSTVLILITTLTVGIITATLIIK
jgi:hypothetical protein